MTVVNANVSANVSANGNGKENGKENFKKNGKENVQGHVQPRHGHSALYATARNEAAVEAKPSVEEAFLAYHNSHSRQHQYSTERSDRFASVATTTTAALKKRREPSDVLDLAHRNHDKRRRQHPSGHAVNNSFAGEARTWYNTSDQLKGDFPKSLGMDQLKGDFPKSLGMDRSDVPMVLPAEEHGTGYNTSDQLQGDFQKSLGMDRSDVPMVLPAEEHGRHVASRFDQSTSFGFPGSIPLVSGPFGFQPMPPPGDSILQLPTWIQLVRYAAVDSEHASSQ
jgi:Ni,Fe-hydrogenase III component G